LERLDGDLPYLQIGCGVKNINHSQFSYDTLWMGGASIIISSRFKMVMDSFLDASGGAMNNRKCQIMGWNISPKEMGVISRIFQFIVAEKWSSFHYLGIPISMKNSTSQEWLPIVEDINEKFTQWGSQC
jgi:hypothetical protein